MREIHITVYDTNDVAVNGEYRDENFLGYDGENEATELTISLPYTGSFYLDWKTASDTDFVESATAYTESPITYDVPDDVLIVGDVYLRIRVVDGSSIMFVDPIKFRVKP